MDRYLIIGGTGSLGRRLIERLVDHNVVAVYSRDEAKHWTLHNELRTQDRTNLQRNFRTIVGDIRDKERLRVAIQQHNPTRIIIAAALKQVDTCEMSPDESVKTNLLGTQNVIAAIDELRQHFKHHVKVLFVSTDKAASPVNTYGMCKALSERLVLSQAQLNNGIDYIATRYGNVLESRGSIIPLFKFQAEHSDYLTVTDPNMTRFVMSLDDSVDLIMYAFENARNGTMWIPRLPAMRIGDLADIFAKMYNKQIKIIGPRPGEKIHEDLINDSEAYRCNRHGDKHYVISPVWESNAIKGWTYSSADDVLSKEELYKHLMSLGILTRPLSEFKGRSIEEIVTT